MNEFEDWSRDWKKFREEPVDSEKIVAMWQRPVPRECMRTDWHFNIFGYRHNHKRGGPRGEQKIEKMFLDERGKSSLQHRLIKKSKLDSIAIVGVAHKVPLAAQRRGQVIPDCLGMAGKHPLAVEIKIADKDTWFAVVENLQQVKMLRSNVSNVKKYFDAMGKPDIKGAWGMVLAPTSYFNKKKSDLEASLNLIDHLACKTEARIMLVSSDNISKKELLHVGGYWPK